MLFIEIFKNLCLRWSVCARDRLCIGVCVCVSVLSSEWGSETGGSSDSCRAERLPYDRFTNISCNEKWNGWTQSITLLQELILNTRRRIKQSTNQTKSNSNGNSNNSLVTHFITWRMSYKNKHNNSSKKQLKYNENWISNAQITNITVHSRKYISRSLSNSNHHSKH